MGLKECRSEKKYKESNDSVLFYKKYSLRDLYNELLKNNRKKYAVLPLYSMYMKKLRNST